MNPATEIRILAAREMRRSVRSTKGIVLGLLTLLGAFVTSFVCVWLEGKQRALEHAMSTEQFVELKRQLLEKQMGDAARAAYEANVPLSLHAFLEITIWLAPLLIALLGFDVMSSELQHRSVRFWTVRVRRSSYFVGKFFGLWALVGLITLALNVISGAVAMSNGYVTPAQFFTWGLRFWLVALLITGTWAAVATFISSCFKTPVVALLTTFAAFFVLWLLGVAGLVSRTSEAVETSVLREMRWYEYFYPNAYDSMLLAPEATKVVAGVCILLAFMALVTVAGSALFSSGETSR